MLLGILLITGLLDWDFQFHVQLLFFSVNLYYILFRNWLNSRA